MNNEEIKRSVLQLLQENSTHDLQWVHAPEVMHIPYMGTRQSFFLLISIVLSFWPDEKERLVNHCLAICRSIIGSRLLRAEKGLEIVAYINKNTKMHRIIRLSVLESAFSKIVESEAAEIIGGNCPGITCQFPPTK